jgi:hypothetical protein
MAQASLFTTTVQVESKSKPGVFYTVDLQKKTCTCPQFLFRHKACSHLNELGVAEKAKMPYEVTKATRDQMALYHKLSLTRLSPNYILRDFLFSTESDVLNISNRPSDDLQQVIKSGKALCEKILEPLREQFGPLSITFGYQSRDLIEAGSMKMAKNSSSPHQWDRGTFGEDIYARVDVLIYAVETGAVTKDEVGNWMMYNLDVDLLMEWEKTDIFCITISPKPRRVWLEWVKQGTGTNGSNKIEKMGVEFWKAFPIILEEAGKNAIIQVPKFYPSATNGYMSWNQK